MHMTLMAKQTNHVIDLQHLNFSDLKGVDGLGNSYVAQNLANGVDSFSSGAIETATTSVLMVTTGSALNFRVQLFFHITVNPNGSITSFVMSSTSTCVG
jgi:hypothetical protein